MKTAINLNFYRDFTKPEDVNVLRNLKKEHITDKGGDVSFDWSMEQCGNTIWYTLHGYIGEIPVTITYKWL